MYMMLKIAEFSRLFQSIEKQFFFFDQVKSVSARFSFAFVVALFLSLFSLRTEPLFVRLTEPGKSLSTAFQKVLLCRLTVLKIRQQPVRKVKKT